MRRCGRCSSRLRVDSAFVVVSFLVLCVFGLGEAWVAHPKRLTSLRDEWRLIGLRHPSFSWRTVNDARTVYRFRWDVPAIKEVVRTFLAKALLISCGIGIARKNRLKFYEQPNAGWGRQMRRHPSRSDVSRVCLPQLASPRAEGKDPNKKGLPSKTRSP